MAGRLYSIASIFLILFVLRDGRHEIRPSESEFQWPNGAKAAVCLTYDDGLNVHLDIVQPDLDVHGFKGTFFCTGNSQSLANRMDDWRALTKAGHELGNHSLYHPCIKNRKNGQTFDWIKPEYDLGKYSVQQMINELALANVLLKSVDGNIARTYAYTCSDQEASGQSFTDALRPLFTGARSDGQIPQSMRDVDLHAMPSWGVGKTNGTELIEYVKQAAKKGTIATFMFHGVGGEHNIVISREDHQQLLKFLADHRDTYWVDTFIHVVDHIKKENKRLEALKK
jgi:sialate O-acetylesterase